ncbi:cellulase family glycosylhydrolase [Pseudoxanthomonas sp. JBR18]|uniref:cellulase family glycosylhydrolase n=1 Tax=Pseudoxanthomonas sp. JBR18 TaxID=2969308 RepID=UPI002304DC86|nr:cellulase family glycosylhydrolase [Pseudoxanthomonas sp. JBR18]WCE04870.1 cellulase family glycosylhydrolase [Pseudoxanthomonas sp. JBR18]
MKPSCLACLLLAVSLSGAAAAQQAPAPDYLHAQGTRIVDGQGRDVLLRGFGLGGWMLQEGYMLELPQFGTQRVIRANIKQLIGEAKTEAFYTAWLDHHTTKADIDALGAWGFNSVRLPMHYALYTLPVEDEPVPGRQTWIKDGFARTDALIGWAKANDMRVILDMHAAPGGQGNDVNIADRDPSRPSLWDDPAAQDKLVALWVELAKRYRDEPAVAAYDLLNEPNWGFADAGDLHGCQEADNAPLRALLVRITRAIRQVDPHHMLVIEGNCWGNNYRGMLEDGLWDDNLVLSFHKYWNPATRQSIADILALRDRYQVPLWLGETGENSNDWYTRTVALAEGEGIGWSWWPLKKIRYNNPLQVVPNPGYRALLAYWHGEGPKPSPEQAEAALMQLATHDVAFAHNLQHPDVVDALLRAPHSDRAMPFKQHLIGANGGRMAAVDFDLGPDGVAYHDLTAANESTKAGGVTWNPAMAYRNDGVDLSRDPDGRLWVAQLQRGEWVRYTFQVARGGRYDLALETRGAGAAQATVLLNGDPVDATSAGFAALALQPGTNTLVLRADAAPFDLGALRFTPAR